MNIRKNSPEHISDQDRLQVESHREEVRADVFFALSTIYSEHAATWSAQTARTGQATVQQPAISNAAGIIDHAFLKTNIETQTSQLASERAVTEAQFLVEEALDEFSA